jgi:hypothetical protein
MRMELGWQSGGGAASERERGDGALDRRVPVYGAGEGVRSGVWFEGASATPLIYYCPCDGAL